MKKIALLIVCLSLLACQQKRKYKYTEFVVHEKLNGGNELKMQQEKIVEAVNDSIAYCEAYITFLSSNKVAKHMIDKYGSVPNTPVSFMLIDDKGEDLTKGPFTFNWNKCTKELRDVVDSMKIP